MSGRLPLLMILLLASSAKGASEVHQLRIDVPTTAVITGVTGGAWIASEALFKRALAPARCRWCDRDAAGNSALNPLDAWGLNLRWENTALAARISDVDAFVLLPLAVGASHAWVASRDGAASGLPVDALIVAEAVVITVALTQLTKFVAGRERPFVHALPEDQKPLTAKPTDNNVSFFSGHTSFAFSLAVAAGTVAELRGYSGRALVWALGIPLASAVPLLRMMADKHYLTDVLLGFAVGSAVGAGVPLLLHPRVGAPAIPVSVAVGPQGVGVTGQF